MSTDPLHQAHDKLFKAGFGDPATAAAFLCSQLPAPVVSALDRSGMRLELGSFVDSHFRASESDLLFSVPTRGGGESLVYVLFEHQRVEDRWIALRLLRYMVRIWERYRATGSPEQLPTILPVVLAQNAKPWATPVRFRDLVAIPEGAGDSIPDFSFRLIQLANLPYGAIQGSSVGVLTLRVLKAETLGDLLGDAVWDESLLAQVPAEAWERVLRYLLWVADLDRESVDRRVQSVQNPNIRQATMTVAQQLIEEGVLKGRHEGLALGRTIALRESVLEAIEVRFGAATEELARAIHEVTDDERLRALHKAALRAESIEAFTQGL